MLIKLAFPSDSCALVMAYYIKKDMQQQKNIFCHSMSLSPFVYELLSHATTNDLDLSFGLNTTGHP